MRTSIQSLLYLGLSATLHGFTNAVRFPLVGRSTPTLARRTSIIGDTGPLNDTSDIAYYINITLGGSTYIVEIDTGSSDLWVSGKAVPNAVGTGKTASIAYAIGAAEGPLLQATLEFAGYTVENQFFFFATANATNPLPAPGIIGLGPFLGSEITATLTTEAQDVRGLPPLDNIFRQNPTSANYITVLLGRVADAENNYPGDLTIMETLSGYEDIHSQPQLPVQIALDSGDQHWSVLIDEDGIIGSDGQPISVETAVKKTPNKEQLTAFFDTGFTLPQVPVNVSKAFYEPFESAKLENISGTNYWTLSCEEEVNITFKIGGKTYPVHPLDATLPLSVIGLDRNDCFGTFQGATEDSGDFDMILGMAFLRNVYILIDFGNDFAEADNGTKVLNGTYNTAAPFIQLLSTTNNTAEAHADFIKVRGNGGSGSSALGADTSNIKQKANNIIKKAVIICAAVGGVVLLLLIACCCFCLCRRRGSSSRGLTVPKWPGSSTSYRPLGGPAPAAAVDVHVVPYASDGYRPPQYGAGRY